MPLNGGLGVGALGDSTNGTRPAAGKTLLVWDYDWSLIDTNSDTFVVQQLRPELMERFEVRDSSLGWTALMDMQMGGLFNLGVSRQELLGCVASVPVHPGCLAAARLAGDRGAAQIVLSDANTIFIKAFLEKQGVQGLFQEVITNPAEFDAQGRLHIAPHHYGEPHGCPLCPANLCKGAVLERVRAALGPERIIYVGDGGGDFCPACDLGPGDSLLCRTPPSPPLEHFGLHRRLQRSREDPAAAGTRQLLTRQGGRAAVAAAVRPWHSGEDVLRIVEELLDDNAVVEI